MLENPQKSTQELAPEHRDKLTGYANRAWLDENLPIIIGESPGSTAVLFIDVDGLKTVNDSLGHDAGDKLIIDTADTIEGSIRHNSENRPGDVVGRLVRQGGDELVVVLGGVKSTDDMRLVRDRIQRNLEEKAIRASIGGSLHQTGDTSSSDMLKRADLAMLEEKEARRKARFEMLPKRKQIAGKLGSRLVRYAGINPPRQ